MKTYKEQNGVNYVITVDYNNGDTYRTKRGFYLFVCPVTFQNNGTYTVELYTPADGVRYLLSEVNRYSAKRMIQAEKLAEEAIPDAIEYLENKRK